MRRILCLILAVWSVPANADEISRRSVDGVFFENKVRPILVDRCYDCHGEDLQESGLRVDSLQALIHGGERGPAIKIGSAKESLMILAINHGEELKMPEEEKLSVEQINVLTEWVDGGAPWPNSPPVSLRKSSADEEMVFSREQRDHWSFQTPQLPDLPSVRDRRWATSPIDFFILRKLESHELSPAPPANKRQLIRRAYFDLIGLPPTPAQVQNFVHDSSPVAFERVIDQLLTSQHYGERWGRHWLDVARYADSNGLDENVAFQFIYKYRDWVIRSMNRDLPFDQFVIEQLAGDLVKQQEGESRNDYIERVKAAGFLSVGPKMVADDDPKKKKMDLIDEQLNTVGQAFLGLTLGCARCHDHKFDPISTYEYYALAGIFKSTKTLGNLGVVAPIHNHEFKPPGFDVALKAHQSKVKQLEDKIEGFLDEAAEQFLDSQRKLVRQYVTVAMDWGVFGPLPQSESDIVRQAEDFQDGKAKTGTRDDVTFIKANSSVSYEFDAATDGTYRVWVRYAAKKKQKLRLTIDDASPVEHQPWLVINDNDNPSSQRWIPVCETELKAGKHTLRLDDVRINVDQWAVVKVESPLGNSTNLRESIKSLASESGLDDQLLQQWILHLLKHQTDDASVWKPLRESIGNAAVKQDELAELQRTFQAAIDSNQPKKMKRLMGAANRHYWTLYARKGPFRRPEGFERKLSGQQKTQLAKIRQDKKQVEAGKPTPDYIMAVTDDKPEDLTVMLRGNYLTPGVQTKRSFLRVIEGDDRQPIKTQHSGRLELAKWITKPNHPLTARVIVNRVWRWHFGRGIVASTDNFGILGQKPSHQQLLDLLAVRFVEEDKWSLKRLHKRIMLSSTYRMSSTYDEAAAAVDPENTMLWRFPRRRLEAEPIRDAMLAVSETLDPKMHGTLMTFKDKAYVTGTASKVTQYENRRRTVYQPVYRSAVYDVLTAFDFPDPATLNGDRQTSIIAPQALLMMNSDLVERTTRALAEQLVGMSKPDESRMVWLYVKLFGRTPNASETLTIGAALEQLQQRQSGEDVEVKCWQSICRALMSTNEFIYID